MMKTIAMECGDYHFVGSNIFLVVNTQGLHSPGKIDGEYHVFCPVFPAQFKGSFRPALVNRALASESLASTAIAAQAVTSTAEKQLRLGPRLQ